MKTAFATIVKIELIKLIKRKDWMALLALAAISILFGAAIMTDGYVGAYGQSALFWVGTQVFNASILFITPMVAAFTSSRLLSAEIENGGIMLYANKYRNRRKMYLAKSLSLTCYVTFAFVVLCLVNLAIYYLLAARNPIFTTGSLFGENTTRLLISLLAIYLSSFLIVSQFAFCLGAFMKPLPVIGITFFIVLVAHNTFKVPMVNLLNPWYYVIKVGGDTFSTTESILLDYGSLLPEMISLILLSAILVFLFNIIGVKRFQKMDL